MFHRTNPTGIPAHQFGKEGSALKGLLKHHSPPAIREQCAKLIALIESGRQFWSGCPILPSALSVHWARIDAEANGEKLADKKKREKQERHDAKLREMLSK
jgi:hypothetical protein